MVEYIDIYLNFNADIMLVINTPIITEVIVGWQF